MNPWAQVCFHASSHHRCGRGSPLEHRTDEFARKDVVFACGCKTEIVKQRYAEFTDLDNDDWQKNNILL